MKRHVAVLVMLAGIVLAHLATYPQTELFYNNDETRHAMTGVFFHDLFIEHPVTHVREWVERYYERYPALGLLVWPPLFYVLTGAVMVLLGTSPAVAKGMVVASSVAACWFLYRLVSRTHDRRRAAAAAALLGLAPMVFELSHQVMLEMPALAFSLASMWYFKRYLEEDRRRWLTAATACAAAAVLTRYDAAVLAGVLAAMVATERRWDLVRRREVWCAAAIALLALAPVLGLAAVEVGKLHYSTMREANPGAPAPWSVASLVYYPRSLAGSLGWILPVAIIGLGAALRRESRIYLAMIGVTMVTFSAIAEKDPRHAILWIPAWCVLAAEGAWLMAEGLGRQAWAPAIAALPAALCLGQAVINEPGYVRGYEQAARLTSGGTVLFDGFLDGNFIYQVRRQDPGHRTSVRRLDREIYHVPGGNLAGPYVEHVTASADILAHLDRSGAQWLVLETRPADARVAAAHRLREVVRGHPERFELAARIPVETNRKRMTGVALEVYRAVAARETVSSRQPIP